MPLINEILLGLIIALIVLTLLLSWRLYLQPALASLMSLSPISQEQPVSGALSWSAHQLDDSEAISIDGVQVVLDKVEAVNLGEPFGRFTQVSLSIRSSDYQSGVQLSTTDETGYSTTNEVSVHGLDIRLLEAKGVGDKTAVIEIRKTPASS